MAKKPVIKKDEKSYLATECDKVGEIAVQYGFTVIKPPHIQPADVTKTKPFKEFDYYTDADEKVALTEWYVRENLQGQAQPLMVHYKKPLHGSGIKKKTTEEMYGFEIMGSGRSTSEALCLKTALAILSDCGYKDVYVDINSIGDKESIVKFEREMASYYRKNNHLMPAKTKNEFKKNPYMTLVKSVAEMEAFSCGAPQTIGSLSDLGRIHFKEVLEYLEAFDIAYKIKPNLFANKTYAAHTVFEIRHMTGKGDESALLAYGYRYNYLAKKIGHKKEIPCIGLTVVIKKQPALAKKIIIKNIKKPKFYLVQLGSTAKLKALNVVEILRKNKIPVYHSMTKDKITGQLTGAEYMHATHVLIIGQKEANENTVVVRDINTRAQETVPVNGIVEYLKKIDKSGK